MRAPRLAALALLAALLAGCVGGPPMLRVERVFAETSASYVEGSQGAPGHYEVHARGRVVNEAPQDARGVRVQLGVAGDCAAKPPGAVVVEVGNLAGSSRANFAETFVWAGPRVPQLHLGYELLRDERSVADRGCGPIPVG